MNFFIRLNLAKAYQSGKTPEKVKKDHLYRRIISPEYLIRDPVRIDLWVSSTGEQFKVNTGYKIAPIHWDFHSQRPKRTCPNFTQLSTLLNRQKTGVEEQLMQASIENPMLTYEDVKQIVREFIQGKTTSKPKPVNSFWTGFEEFMQFKEKQVDESTLKKYQSLKTLLFGYQSHNNTKLDYSIIQEDFFLDFTSYLSEEKQQINGTIEKYIRCIKAFMNWATDRGFNTDLAFRKYRCKRSEPEVIYVSQQELERIEKLPITTSVSMERCRDIWLFGVYTGQRYGDIENLSPQQIIKYKDRWEWHLYQRKGSKPKKVVIPLRKKAVQILKKHGRWDQEKLLPALSNQKANEMIKKVACLAGLKEPIYMVKYSARKRVEINKPKWQLITTHTARKTFITQSLEKKMSLDTIMTLCGISEYKTLKHYKKIVDSFVREDYHNAWGD